MAAHNDAESFTKLIRDFMASVREHIATLVEEGDPETVEKFFAGCAAIGAAVLLLIPGKRKDGLLHGLIAALSRFVHKGPADG